MSSENTSFDEITVRFVKWRYRSEDGSFCIGLYEDAAKKYNFVTVVGANLPEVYFPVTFSGQWVNDPKFGRQFKVEWIVTQLPSKTADMEEFICSMKVGIGKKRVAKMVSLTGADAFWDTLNNNPEVFLKIGGITESIIKKLQNNISSLNYQRDILQFLRGDLKMDGARFKRLTSLYKNRLDEMLPDIQYNPFILQQIGIPFSEIDYFCAKHSGFTVNDNRRLTAAAIQVLLDAQRQSHVAVPTDVMVTRLQALLSHQGAISRNECRMFLDALLGCRFITKDIGMFYLTRAYNEETYVAEAILSKLNEPAPTLDREEVDKTLYEYGMNRKDDKGNSAAIILADGQKDAVYTALTNRFCIVTGGPGTGKSTILDAILYCWKKFYKDDDWLLMAPTGKASVRMTQATGQHAGTIHSTLGLGVSELPLDPDAPSLHPLDVKQGLVVVDEASMLDLSVMTALLKAVKDKAQHLVLVGDPEQLPSVGYGNILADLINSKVVPVARLTTIYRQAAGNPIIINAKKMREGDTNLVWTNDENKTDKNAIDGMFIGYDQRSDEANMKRACRYFMQCVNKLGIKKVVMLSPYHKKGAISTNAMNALLQEAFNPDKGRGQVKSMGQILRFGDRVMQLKNTETAVNGDVGTIQLVNEDADVDEPCVVVKFDDSDIVKEYTKDELNQLELAYAISVHKSQGSQYPCVIMVLPYEHSPFLQRSLVYTGMTRASKYVAFFGPLHTLQYAIANARLDERYTGLVQRLQNGSPAHTSQAA